MSRSTKSKHNTDGLPLSNVPTPHFPEGLSIVDGVSLRITLIGECQKCHVKHDYSIELPIAEALYAMESPEVLQQLVEARFLPTFETARDEMTLIGNKLICTPCAKEFETFLESEAGQVLSMLAMIAGSDCQGSDTDDEDDSNEVN